MPGISQPRPARASTLGIYLSTYTTPAAFPGEVWNALRQNERAANVLLPQALSALHEERTASEQFWITCKTAHSPHEKPQLEFILSCTEWHMGTYPVFLVSTLPSSSLTPAFLAPRVAMLASELRECVPSRRVYSIFAPAPLAKAFAQAWTNVAGVKLEENPYYAARFSHCSKGTHVGRTQTAPADMIYNLRLACEDDVSQVAALCKGFASDSVSRLFYNYLQKFIQPQEPFVLDEEGALKEATYLIANQFAWVHEVIHNGKSELACLVATTRNSERVHTISKVYTPPAWRKRGCAERLVRHVCQ